MTGSNVMKVFVKVWWARPFWRDNSKTWTSERMCCIIRPLKKGLLWALFGFENSQRKIDLCFSEYILQHIKQICHNHGSFSIYGDAACVNWKIWNKSWIPKKVGWREGFELWFFLVLIISLQWLTAGRGIVHCETPGEGGAEILQLWINLAKKHKMAPAAYQDLNHADITVTKSDGVCVYVLAGKSMEMEVIVQ